MAGNVFLREAFSPAGPKFRTAMLCHAVVEIPPVQYVSFVIQNNHLPLQMRVGDDLDGALT